VTERIDGATPLGSVTQTVIWHQAGQLVARMHRMGVFHADLNVFNILLDSQARLWLIDFDRSWQGILSDNQRKANIDRLLRSVKKVRSEDGLKLFDAFLAGYDLAYESGG
jgi:3-deoxy-D-manno-octulosonic acid kinase